jgi:hypothetical protein
MVLYPAVKRKWKRGDEYVLQIRVECSGLAFAHVAPPSVVPPSGLGSKILPEEKCQEQTGPSPIFYFDSFRFLDIKKYHSKTLQSGASLRQCSASCFDFCKTNFYSGHTGVLLPSCANVCKHPKKYFLWAASSLTRHGFWSGRPRITITITKKEVTSKCCALIRTCTDTPFLFPYSKRESG